MNLSINASHAIHDAGEVHITLSEMEIRESQISKSKENEIVSGKYLQLTVSDSGIGMGDQTVCKLFTPFLAAPIAAPIPAALPPTITTS